MRLVCWALLALLSWTVPAAAMTVWPTVIDLTSLGRDSRAQINVVSDEATAFPVEVWVESLTIAEDGSQSFADASGDFVIFPPQAIIQPGATQIFRIQWAGDPALAQSRSYAVRIEQVPVRPSDAGTSVQLVYSFAVIVNVASPQSQPALVVVEAAPVREGGKAALSVLLENKGDRYAYLSRGGLSVSGNGWSTTIGPEELGQLIGMGLVQPGARRRFSIAAEIPTGVRSVTAELTAPAQP
ncbi:fimbrial biogenesis chaperone [Geminicoccus roseus]|uniref:fimbrial biogenesis chaperone n=1 Tax=Geminicoccus roseus TaxID=404900 RepID=UPI0006882C4C|nr:fimbria/pilus periplasmic chaperone [Geminicoccus roseus]